MSKTRIVFVHGSGRYGAAAWPTQHRLAGRYDCLFLKRTGFDAVVPPQPTDFAADEANVIEALGAGGHVVAHAQGAIAAMMAAVARPDLVRSLVLVEPACLSLTAELPASAAYRGQLERLYARRGQLTDAEFARELARVAPAGGFVDSSVSGSTGTGVFGGGVPESADRVATRLRLQAPPWEAPLHIVPGVPTLVLTGGWEPLYEEIAGYLVTTGARHLVAPGGHRLHDLPEGAALIEEFIAADPGGGGL
ncbi:alpha/beta hydrolase [Specibacter cremeus]|uniref:alpha/beta hydrolase n=1 Tax=Specibacter cremeus TaxID=1629051 RepID=UPI000F77BE31|nr:alpha/beta hydrolase [Specibacter cremeus]